MIDSMGAVSTAHANPPAVMRDFGWRTLYSFQSWTSALPFRFWHFCQRGKDLDLDGNASWMFWIPMSFKNSSWRLPGVRYLGAVCLQIYSYDWSSTICCCWADYGLYSCSLPAYSMHRRPPLNTIGSITYYSATRVWMGNTHLWWFWRWWSKQKCSIGSSA